MSRSATGQARALLTHYRLSDLHFTIAGEHPAVRHLADELAPRGAH